MITCKTLPSVPVPQYSYYNPINYGANSWLPTYIHPTYKYDFNSYYDYLNTFNVSICDRSSPADQHHPQPVIDSVPASSIAATVAPDVSSASSSYFNNNYSSRSSISNKSDNETNIMSFSSACNTINSGINNTERTSSVIMKVENEKITEIAADAIALSSGGSSISRLSSCESSCSGSDLEEYICKWTNCHRHFDHHDKLVLHVKKSHIHHDSGKLYQCQWEGCPRSERGFNARYKILVHIRTHTKEKPHECPECHKCFSRAENLKIHVRTHSGEKPYLCPFEGCSKAYSNSSDRFKHTRTHAVEKPYFCKIAGCNKRYTDPSSLRKHVKTFKHSPVISELSNNCEQTIFGVNDFSTDYDSSSNYSSQSNKSHNIDNLLSDVNIGSSSCSSSPVPVTSYPLCNSLELSNSNIHSYNSNSNYECNLFEKTFVGSQTVNDNSVPLDLSIKERII